MQADLGLISALVIAAIGSASFGVFGLYYKRGLEFFSLGWLFIACGSLMTFQSGLIDIRASIGAAFAMASVGLYLQFESIFYSRTYRMVAGNGLLIVLAIYSLFQIALNIWPAQSVTTGGLILDALLIVAFGIFLIVRFYGDKSSRRAILGFIYVYGGSTLAFQNIALFRGWPNSFELPVPSGHQSHMPSDEILFILAVLAVVTTIVRLGDIFHGLSRDIALTVQQAKATRSQLEQQLAIGHLDQSRSLSMLSATLAHELNQPLTAIITNSGLAQRYLKPSEFNSELLASLASDIERDIRRTSDLLNHYLGKHSSLMDIGQEGDTQTDVLATICSVLEWLSPQIEQSGVVCHITTGATTARTQVKAVYLSQVLVNLLRNSAEAMKKYRGQSKKILIGLTLVANDIVISVSDTGPGMDEEALQTISEQFGSQKREGLGLGLSISRWIIERNGGRMTLWSAPGEGFHVQLVLPIMEDTK